MEELQKEIERIRREQEELVFAAFDEETAWETGKRLRQTALEKGVRGGHFRDAEPQAALCLRHGGDYPHQRRVDQAERKYGIQVFQELL